MRTCLLLCALFILFGCKKTDLAEGFSIGGGSGSSDNSSESDTTPPTLTGSISHVSDTGSDQAPTSTWQTATDDSEVSFYELAIGEENGDTTCDESDFDSPVLNWTQVPDSADFAGGGFQAVDGNNDGKNQGIDLNLKGDRNHCMAVRATDSSGNISDPIYSASTFQFLYSSCLQALNNEPGLADGVYNIDPDGLNGEAAFFAFCDMSTQGGGWTLVIRYDASVADGTNYFLPTNSGRSQINIDDIQSLASTGNLSASVNMIPLIQNGATMLMHVGKPNDAATDSSTYGRIYFSDIYQSVIDTPNQIFDSSLDTNASTSLSGAIVNGVSATRKDRWYESDMSLMTVWDTTGATTNSYRIDGGEGDAMFTNGNREGAVYCSGSSSSTEGHGDPKVQWGFAGADGSGQTYGGTIYIGTHCSAAFACAPENTINLMLIR